MNHKIYFCKSWFRSRREPTEVWTEGQAQEAHAARRLYTVLVDSLVTPSCFIEIANDFVGVGFLDSKLRGWLSYQFQEVEPGRVFLSMVTRKEYIADSDVIKMLSLWVFKRDGSVRFELRDLQTQLVEEGETTRDVSAHYDQWPDFGEYDGFLVIDRNRKH